MCGNCGLQAELPRPDLLPHVPEFLAPPEYMRHSTREELRAHARDIHLGGPISKMTKAVLRDSIYTHHSRVAEMARQLNMPQMAEIEEMAETPAMAQRLFVAEMTRRLNMPQAP